MEITDRIRVKAMQWHERIGRRLKLRDMNILLEVAHSGSMAKAAARLAISQPAVSKAVADMEHAIGLRLLDRTPRGIEPTMYGAALVRRAAVIFDELKQAVDELESLADPYSGELRIGASESVAAGFLPAAIDRFSLEYPGIVVKAVQTVVAPLDFRELRERAIDLQLGRIPTAFCEEDLSAEVMFDDQIHIVTGLGSRWARRRRIALHELMDEAWALPTPDSLPGAMIAAAFLACCGKMPRVSVVTSSIHLLGEGLPATGRFLTILPASVLRFGKKRRSLKILPVELPIEPRPVGIIWLKDRTLTPAARLFADCARVLARPMAPMLKTTD
jgi:DNA-binding transcriptional LysR family regulator